jgi:hypothetical protein
MNVGAVVAGIVVGIVVSASGIACVLFANYQYMELQFELNERLPEDQKFEPLFWTLGTRQRFRQLQKKVLPGSTRPKQALGFALLGFCLLFSGGLLVLSNVR